MVDIFVPEGVGPDRVVVASPALEKPPATFPQVHTLCVVGVLQTTPRGFSRSYTKGNVRIETVVEQDRGQSEVCPKEARWRSIDPAPDSKTAAELDR